MLIRFFIFQLLVSVVALFIILTHLFHSTSTTILYLLLCSYVRHRIIHVLALAKDEHSEGDEWECRVSYS